MSVRTSIDVVRISRLLSYLVAAVTALAPLTLEGCVARKPPKVLPDDPRFDDFSTSRLTSLAEFRQLAAAPTTNDDRPAILGAKFVISDFSDPRRRRLHFLDGRAYQFHDEWAWFRLLNGQPVSGMEPLEPHPFASPQEARRWGFAHEGELPDGLEITDGRLYARRFYDLTLSRGRPLGAGTLVHVEARAGKPEVWGFEVDYTDPANVDELLVFFTELERAVPDEAKGKLRWFARSPEQLEVGRALAKREARYQGRVLTYGDVSVPGETAVYTGGIVAGRLRAMRELSRLAESEPEDILLLGALPEYLPQARGLVTAIPQTPLAHLNLLAKSRQIVNAYRGGLLDDPEVQDLARSRAPVVLSAERGRLVLHRLTEEQYQAWQALLRSDPPNVPSLSLQNVPYVLKLSDVAAERLPKLSPLIGGKCSGMVHLLRGLGPGTSQNGSGSLQLDVPDRPLCVTIRAYREHLQPLLPELRALLADSNFLQFKKLRFLALEGAKEFQKKFPSKKDRELAKSYENPLALGPIAAVVRKGGVQHMLRHAELPAAFRAELERTVGGHFAAYSPEQGLRFRSSSTVEDIEGFNGAGLYDSSTGYLVPRKASGKQAKRPSLADAVRKTWASYYSAEAFEERHQNHIDHLAADMAVLVHARFDDELEASNGVFTFTLAPGLRELSVDAQPGSVSVTNPPTDRVVIPESSRVRGGQGEPSIQRQSLSSLAPAGRQVLADADLKELFRVAEALTAAHLEQDNAGVPPAQQRRALVMDFEFRRVHPGWPALKTGQNPARFVVKQARPLEPSPHVSEQLRAAPIPHDVLARARRIETQRCTGVGLELTLLEVFTNPDAAPDLGYGERPLLAGLGVSLDRAKPRVFTHLEQRSAAFTPQGVRIELLPGHKLTQVEVSDGVATLSLAGGARRVIPVKCESRLDYAEPRELLRSYVASAASK